MSETQQGRVKWFNNRKGFGFLTDCNSNDDIFIHFSAIQTPKDVYKALIEGEYVQYTPGTDKEGKSVALNVTGICGGPLLCENTERRVYSIKRESEENTDRQQRGDRQQRRRGQRRNTRQTRRYERRSEESDEVQQESTQVAQEASQ